MRNRSRANASSRTPPAPGDGVSDDLDLDQRCARRDRSMTIRKIPRDPEGIESLKLYASLDPLLAVGADLQDPARLDEFLDRMKTGVSASVQKASRLHGLRVEALFRAMLVALGGFTLLTDVDGGEPYFDDSGGPVKLPDFCVVARDGQQLLVEVKNRVTTRPFEATCHRQDRDAWTPALRRAYEGARGRSSLLECV